jgi:hypothetical protein
VTTELNYIYSRCIPMAVQDIAKHDYCFLICFQLLSKLYRARYKTNITKDFY